MKKTIIYMYAIAAIIAALAVGGCDSGVNDGNPSAKLNSFLQQFKEDAGAEKFTVTYDKNGNYDGEAPVDSNLYMNGSWVTIMGTGSLIKSGYNFKYWYTKSDDGGGESYPIGHNFRIFSNIKLYAIWMDATVLLYNVTVIGGNGGGSYKEGELVTIVAEKPEDGLQFESWVVTRGNVYLNNPSSQRTTFTMPRDEVVITANFVQGKTSSGGVPEGVIAIQKSSVGITVSWYPVAGARGYFLYRATSANGDYAKVTESFVNTPYTDYGLMPGVTYYYKVTALGDGGESEKSLLASVMLEDIVITYGTLKDNRDSKIYKTVKIGGQTWMAENLNYDTLDGTGSWCYDNNADNCDTYGRLYDWATAMNIPALYNNVEWRGNDRGRHRGICPMGWHLSSGDDYWFGGLLDLMSGTGDAGDMDNVIMIAGNVLKSKSGWGNDGNGIDAYGFSALPSGYQYPGGGFTGRGTIGYWWSDGEYNHESASTYWMESDESLHNFCCLNKRSGFSVRCVQDD